MWKILPMKIRDGVYISLESLELFSKEQKEYGKIIRGKMTNYLLRTEGDKGKKNVAIESIGDKKSISRDFTKMYCQSSKWFGVAWNLRENSKYH